MAQTRSEHSEVVRLIQYVRDSSHIPQTSEFTAKL
jgi:hypothetical protein